MNQLAGIQSWRDLRKLTTRLSVIAVAMMLVGALTLVGTALLSAGSLTAVMVAWLLCVVSCLLGHALSQYPSGNEFIMTRLMSSMMMRAGVPLGGALLVKLFFEQLLHEGFVYFLVLFYLVGIISEAVLSTLRLRYQ